MQTLDARRFRRLAEALGAEGEFRPVVDYDTVGELLRPKGVAGSSALVPYPRESLAKYASRAAVAYYENHLLSACQRFVGYLAKRPPSRELPGPFDDAFVQDCDWRGNDLDVFWLSFMAQAKARGSMLLLVDMPRELPDSQADQLERRALPYLVAVPPEDVVDFQMNDRGELTVCRIRSLWTDPATGQQKAAIRAWDATQWAVIVSGQTVEQGDHAFGRCPVLAFSESGEFPSYGEYEQIADLSRRIYNARSELDEILRSQTFSLLTYQVPPEQTGQFNAQAVAEAIGTHNMLIHAGQGPAFIAPSEGPARVYMDVIAKLEEAIRRVSLTIESPEAQTAESGLALTVRFQALNSALVSFARRMEDLERRMWGLVAAGLGVESRATVAWAKDFAIADVARELETLSVMQGTAMPEAVISEQMRTVVTTQFSTADQTTLDGLLAAIDERAAEIDAELPEPQKQEPLSLVINNLSQEKGGRRRVVRTADGSYQLEDVE
jgi:hypothetical protein